MPSEPFAFSGGQGRQLRGVFDLPDAPVRGWALFAHCFACSKDSLAAARIARGLARAGIGVLRFDFAGQGLAQTPAEPQAFAADLDDLKAAAAAMAAIDRAPALAVGHSLGGAAVLATAGDMPSVRAVVTLGAPFDVAHLLTHIDPAAVAAVATHGVADVALSGRSFVITRGFLDDLRRHDQGSRIARLKRALLVLHAPRDEVVGIDNATRIFMAAMHPKSFVSLDDADHLLSRPADAQYAAGLIASWAARYLPPVDETRSDGQPAAVVAEETGAGKFQVAVRAGGIRLLADEPESVGGLGSGPTPFDLLSAALAACTTMTLRMYADIKGLTIRHIATSVGHLKRKDVEPADLFTRRIAIDGDIDAAQRQRLLEIADRCPVHRTLLHGSAVETVEDREAAMGGPVAGHAQDMAREVR